MPENIDEEFHEAMRSIGGRRPAEIDATAGQTLNADIVFKNENIIIEVKTLMSDPTERDDHLEKISAIYNRWVGRPGVPIVYGRRALNSKDLPPEMAIEFLRTLADPIRAAVTKANRQIRAVKTTLDMPDAHGVLLLCNAGATTLTPEVILNAVHHALGKRHGSINSLIFLTHGVPAQVRGVPEPVEIFMPASREGHARLPEDFATRIHQAWMRHLARRAPVKVYSGVDNRNVLDATNVHKKLT